MGKKKALLREFGQYKSEVHQLLDIFKSYHDDALNKTPSQGGWSVLQTMHHVILAEELTLKYIQKKLSGGTDTQHEPIGIKTWYRDTMLSLYLRFGPKFAAPGPVSTENLPERSTFEETKQRWMEGLQKWEHFIGGLDEQYLKYAIYKHPGAGRLSWMGMLNFFRAHAKRHTKQMKKALISCLILCIAYMVQAQAGSKNPLACGTQPERSAWFKDYVANPDAYRSGADSTVYTRLQLHLLANDSGTGRFRTGNLLDALCRLNQDFAGSKIHFFYDKPWNLINKTAWYDHNDLTTGIQMMLQNKVDSAINSYFVLDPAGNCGYNLPYGGVAMAHNCAGPNDHTWAHEIGHALRLPHPFIGWEGKSYNYNNPTPLTLTYDYTNFHDTLDTGPTIDTAFVEFVDRDNCQLAADRLCLTTPDYLASRWPCNAMNQSNTKQKDPDGVDFYSDGSLFMSYSFDECQSRFSDDQIAVMRANLSTEKSHYTKNSIPWGPVTGNAVALEPIGGQIVAPNAVTMRWAKVPGATHYLVQGNRINAAFQVVDFEIVTTDTFAIANNLLNNKTWYYRIRPFNPAYFCSPYSTTATFFTSSPSSVDGAQTESWRVYPTLVHSGFQPMIQLPDQTGFEGMMLISDAKGRVIISKSVQLTPGVQPLPVEFGQWPSGVYLIRLSNGARQEVFKMVIQGQ